MQDCQIPLNSALKIETAPSTSSLVATKPQVFSLQVNPVSSLATLFSCLSLGLLTQQSVMAAGSISILDGTNNLAQVASLPSLEVTSSNILESSESPTALSFTTQIGKNQRDVPQLPSLIIARASSQESSSLTYMVKKGDTVESIARQHGVSTQELVDFNKLSNPHFILVDSQLGIPNVQLSSDSDYQGIELLRQNSLDSASAAPISSPLPFSSLSEKKAQSRKQKRLNRIDSDKATPNVLTEEKASVSDSAKDSYISKLRQDIVKLRNKYQEQSGSQERIVKQTVTTPQVTTNFRRQTLPAPVISPSPLGNTSSTSDVVSFLPDTAIAPSLPPLAAPEEYLPDNPVFDGYIWPAKGTFTSGYGWRWGRMHKGIDIAAPIGTPIIAAASGEVIFSGWSRGGYGNLVKLKHRDGSVTFYAHNNRLLVSKGQKVRQGQLIAEMGSTGRSTGPHLHFEIRPNGSNAINPIARLPKKR